MRSPAARTRLVPAGYRAGRALRHAGDESESPSDRSSTRPGSDGVEPPPPPPSVTAPRGPRAEGDESPCDRPAPAPLQRAAQSARPVADRARLHCPHPPRVRFGGASGAMRRADGGGPPGDRPAPADTTRVEHSARPAAVRAQLGCPHPPRAHHYRVGRALRGAGGASQYDRPAPAPTRRVKHSACRRRTARGSAARVVIRLKPLTAVPAALCATRTASHAATAPPPPRRGPGSAQRPAGGGSRAARHRLVPAAAVWAALCATLRASHSVGESL